MELVKNGIKLINKQLSQNSKVKIQKSEGSIGNCQSEREKPLPLN